LLSSEGYSTYCIGPRLVLGRILTGAVSEAEEVTKAVESVCEKSSIERICLWLKRPTKKRILEGRTNKKERPVRGVHVGPQMGEGAKGAPTCPQE